MNELYAERAEAESNRLMEIGDREVIECSGEKLVPVDDAGLSLADTLENPNMIATGAAQDRLDLAQRAGVLKSAVDAAVTIGAKDSLTKGLAHQLMAAHRSSMKMVEQAMRNGVAVESQARCLNAASRLMQTYQNGLLTLQKLKAGNKQTIVVQHVEQQVRVEGGQAVVTGRVSGRGGLIPHRRKYGHVPS